MKHLWLIALLFTVLAVPLSAQNQEFPWDSGNAFVRVCSVLDKDTWAALENINVVSCTAYVSGVVDGVNYEQSFAEHVTTRKPPKPYCVPEPIENGQEIRIVLKYIRDKPEIAHLPTAPLIMSALSKAYPCPSK